MKETKRLDEIDILKSFGIILMIMGHIGFGDQFDFYIHSFHMPMFYIISGHLYKKSNITFNEFLKKKFHSLIIPYIFWSIFHLIIWYLLCLIFNKEFLLLNFLSIFSFNTTSYMPIAGALWFLTSLFFVDIIYFIIDKLDNKIKTSLIILLSLCGCIIPYYFRLPLALDTSFMGIGLYHIGVLSKKIMNDDNFKKSIICIIIGSIFTFVNGYINVREGIYSNILLYYFVASIMTYGLYGLAYKLNHLNCKIIKEFKFIGRNSLVYVCLNQLILLFLNNFSEFFQNNFLLYVVLKIASLFFVLMILHIIVFILNEKTFRWILGK